MGYIEEKNLEDAYVMGTYGRLPVQFVGGQGMLLEDTEGKRYLDFLSGIAACSLGHGHPVLVDAITDQAKRLVHVSNYFYIEHRGEVAKRLSDLANEGLDPKTAPTWKSFFSNSGAEANECALKLARFVAARSGRKAHVFVALNGSFHGRTMMTLAATMQARFQDELRPLPPECVGVDANDVAGLEQVFADRGDEICGVIMEPLQGESGIHLIDPAFAAAVRRLCDQTGALMIVDEVQSGVFRTGKPFCFQNLGVVPDVFTLAKGIAGGVPMGACVARAQVADVLRPGDHGSTFGGSNLACAAADAVLSELVRMDASSHTERVGAYLQASLASLPHVKDVRGLGLMVGCDLDEETYEAHDLVKRALEAGLVLNATGPHTLRILPPLICEEKDVDKACTILRELLA